MRISSSSRTVVMSLYRLCPWWKTQCPDLEANYDAAVLHSAALTDEPGASELLVVGSHSGHLSIYQPHHPDDEKVVADADKSAKGDEGEFDIADGGRSRPVDVVLEVKLPNPILSVSSAVIISTSDHQRQLIILHPRSLAIYAIRHTNADVADIGNQTTLELCVEHRFEHDAFAVCHGHFGGGGGSSSGTKAAEFLCVTHMSGGLLTFFEQNGIRYECRLPAAGHIPGALHYVPRIDAFVTVSGAAELLCFRYQDAAECAERLRPLEPVWSCCVGEFALDLAVVQTGINDSAIVILGENNLICLTDNGTMRFIKRLDYTPMCFHSFLNGHHTDPNARLMTAVCTDRGGFVLLYAEAKLVWCLQLTAAGTDPQPPVAIWRANLRTLRGAFVTLSATGQLCVGYLGTRPQPHQVPALDTAGSGDGTMAGAVDVPRARQALAELETEIDRTLRLTGDAAVQSTLIGRELHVQMAVAGRWEAMPRRGGRQCMVTVQLRRGAQQRIDSVQVAFVVTSPLECAKPLHMLRNFDVAGQTASTTDDKAAAVRVISTWVQHPAGQPANSAMPANLCVTAIVSFINAFSVFRVVERTVRLPLDMFAKLSAPVKDDVALKITLAVDSAEGAGGGASAVMPTLSGLLAPHFGRLEASTQAVGVRPLSAEAAGAEEADNSAGTDVVTIVSAKNSSRYRLQCSEMTPLLPVMLDVIVARLKGTDDKTATTADGPKGVAAAARVGKITLTAHLPMAVLCAAIEAHNDKRNELRVLQHRIAQGVTQMRLIVRRLFVKLDDKKAATTGGSTLDGLQMLFRLTQDQLERHVRDQQRVVAEARRTRDAVNAWMALLQHMVRYADISVRRRDGLMAILSGTPIRDWLEKDWAEIVQPSVDLLRHTGSLTSQDHESFVFGQSEGGVAGSANAFDIKKLQRNLKDLFEPVFRGTNNSVNKNDDDEDATAPHDENSSSPGEDATGTGNDNEWTEKTTITWQL